MKQPTTTQLFIGGIAIFAAFCFVSDADYHDQLYVEPIIEQAYHDELNKPREALNRLQEDADTMLALQEIKQ